MNRLPQILAATLLILSVTAPRAAPADLVIADFAAHDYGTWKSTGTAFHRGPARDVQLAELEIENARDTEVTFTCQSMSCSAKPVAFSPLTNFEMFIERNSIETFTNDGVASMSKCFLPTESGLSLTATGGRVTIHRLKLVHL